LVSAKVTAVMLGPGGVGYMGLLQSLVGLSAMVAGMGVGAALVRAGAKAIAEADARQLAALRRAGWLLCVLLGGLAAAVLVVAREPVSRIMLGGAEHADGVAAMAFALLFGLGAGLQTSILNAHQRVGDLARVGILSSLLGVSTTVLLIWQWRERGIVPAVLASFAISWAISFYFTRSRVRPERFDLSRSEVLEAAGALLRFGMPFTGSMIVGTGVLMVVPVLVLHALGPTDVGYYRAAATISINYLGFLTTAMAQDYYPRVSAASDRSSELNQLINDQLRLVLLLGGPIILGALALVPYLLPLIYSRQFAPAGELLEWQLIGDLFKFSAWTMSFVILARLGGLTYFWTELFGGSVLLLGSWLGMRWLGLDGLGIGFLLSAASVSLLGWLVLRRHVGLRWSKANKLLFWTFAAAMAIVRALPHLGWADFRTPAALALAVLLGSVSLYLIWSEIGGWQRMLAWRRRA
jgi:PST family polysaccharide transporter